MAKLKNVLSLVMALALIACSFTGVIAFAETEQSSSGSVMGRVHIDNVPIQSFSDLRDSDSVAVPRKADSVSFPSSYSSVKEGYVTAVKDQGNYGTCWAHGAAASAESSMIKNLGYSTDVNISELHLSYFHYSAAYDVLGLLDGDSTTIPSRYKSDGFLDLGGTNICTPFTFARWTGVVDEDKSPEFAYSKANKSFSVSDTSKAYSQDVAHLEDAYLVSSEDIDDLKYMIMTYGAGTIAYYHSDSYFNSSTSAYYYGGSSYANHEVTVVGWDDNFSKSNFRNWSRPSKDGAWLVKNSWGTSWGDKGYFWLSYEDTAFCKEYAAFYNFGPADNYDNNYQYDGSANFDYEELQGPVYEANVFVADSNEELKAVSFWTIQNDVDYSIDIYTNVSGSTSPTSGNKVFSNSVSGNEVYAGYHTVVLPNSVYLNAGTKYSVVVKLSCNSESLTDLMVDKTDLSVSWMIFNNAAKAGQSFYKDAKSSSWTDKSLSGINYRIKAFTDEATDAVDTDTQASDTDASSDAENTDTTDAAETVYEQVMYASSLEDGDRIVLIDEDNGKVLLPSYASDRTSAIASADYDDMSDLSAEAQWRVVIQNDRIYLANQYGHQLASGDMNYAYLDANGSALNFELTQDSLFRISTSSSSYSYYNDMRYLAYNDLIDAFRFYSGLNSASEFKVLKASLLESEADTVVVSSNEGSLVYRSDNVLTNSDAVYTLVKDPSELSDGDKIILYNDVYQRVLTTSIKGSNNSTLSAASALDASQFDAGDLWTVRVLGDEVYLENADGKRMTASNKNSVTLTANGSALSFVAVDDESAFKVQALDSRFLRFNTDIDGYRFYKSSDNSSKFMIYKYGVTSSRRTVVFGDIDNDNQVALSDVITIQKVIAKLVEAGSSDIACGDVDSSGSLTLNDVVILQKHLAGLGTSGKAGVRATMLVTE